MGTNEANQDRPGNLSLCSTFWALNDQSVDIDRRITVLPPCDVSSDVLWQELELVLEKLREVVSQLAKTPAPHILELRAKADVLGMLLRCNDTNGGLVTPKDKTLALALSVIADIDSLSRR